MKRLEMLKGLRGQLENKRAVFPAAQHLQLIFPPLISWHLIVSAFQDSRLSISDHN